MIRKLRVKLVCILMALLTVMLGVTFGLVLHFTQQSLEAESLRTLEALANNWQTASSPGLDDGTRVPYFALEINARGDIITTRGGYFDLSDREKLQKLIDIAVNSEDDIGEVPDYGLRFYRVVTRTSWRVVFADTSAETTTLHSLIRTLAIASAAALAVFFVMSLLLARWLVRPVARAWDQQRQFVADASHELKTPIALIQGYAEGLTAGVADDPEDRKFYCDTIADEADHMNKLVMQLLSLSRLELGAEQTFDEDIDLHALCAEAVRKTAVLCENRGLTVEYENAHITVRTDGDLLDQVLMNYLSNAIRYTPEGKHIEISAARTGSSVRLSVFNEGEGLPEEELPKIWEKFYRTDRARTREAGGTGIGLSLVRAIADTLHGACGAENVEGGICFWFELPDLLPAEDSKIKD